MAQHVRLIGWHLILLQQIASLTAIREEVVPHTSYKCLCTAVGVLKNCTQFPHESRASLSLRLLLLTVIWNLWELTALNFCTWLLQMWDYDLSLAAWHARKSEEKDFTPGSRHVVSMATNAGRCQHLSSKLKQLKESLRIRCVEQWMLWNGLKKK